MKVLRLCLMLTALLLPPLALPVSAQDGPAAPQLRLEFPETSAIPGQPLSLRLTVLVPSFMPKPPV